MIEILFRGKRKGNLCEWVEGYLFEYDSPKSSYILGELDFRESIYDIWKCAEEVIPKTVGQFTGLTDKNGKKIFEGDIVRYMKNDVMVVVWNNESAAFVGAYSAINFNYCASLMNGHMYLEVIGNIHDNPELLEG